jgi:uncharacterized protein YjiS (DUF1127 family)
MSFATTTNRSTAGGGALSFAAGFAGAFRRWRQNRRAEQTLGGFSDAMLRDIGVSRAEIGDAVRHGHPHRNDG